MDVEQNRRSEADARLMKKLELAILTMNFKLNWKILGLELKLDLQMIDLKYGIGYRDKLINSMLKEIKENEYIGMAQNIEEVPAVYIKGYRTIG